MDEKKSKKEAFFNWCKNPKNLVKVGLGVVGTLATGLGIGGLVKHACDNTSILVETTDSFAILDPDEDTTIEILEYTNEESTEE